LKLQALLGFAETVDCRRRVLLSYFGEPVDGLRCGNCDTCTTPVETWDGTLAAQQALSAVYRTGQRFGQSYCIDVLRGADSERIKQFGHDQLPTYGVGSERSKRDWGSVFRQLVVGGYLDVDYEGFGGLRLTEKSRELLTGGQPIVFRAEPVRAAKKAKRTRSSRVVGELDSGSQQLFERLREKRLAIARARKVPPYVIFHDSSLLEMARLRPADLDALSQIPGVGAKKIEQYGRAFLEVLAEQQ
ncbi:MAG: HRDC domain-containing protein, partial [Bdellovibrionales bacterium]|nr:HRDC domain-containing protein [Bdellovibrionales bacterium]